jgi:AGCS family alanine or glycine:cation symporter
MFQSWNVAALTDGYFGVPRVATGILLAVIVGLVIVGGIKRIGLVAAKLVPFMCVLYLLAALAVLAMNAAIIPGLLVEIVTSAFDKQEAAGAFIGGSLGWAFIMGMKRALFSNEAGQGSAPIAHAAAKTGEPAREGIVGGIGPFIDTICICTLTALVILCTNTWNREAIGQFDSPITIVQDLGAEKPTWQINASDAVENLPKPSDRGWREDDKFFLVAEITNTTHNDTGDNRIRWKSTVASIDDEQNPDAAAKLHIDWGSLEIDPKKWADPVTEVRLVDAGIYREYEGAQLTGHAFDREFPGLGKYLVTLAAWLFAISTMISWSYYGEQGMVYMTGQRGVLPYKLVFLALVIGATVFIKDKAQMEPLMDLGTGAMLWSNLPIVFILGYLAVGSLNTYGKRLKAGEFPRHKAPKMEDVISGKDVE